MPGGNEAEYTNISCIPLLFQSNKVEAIYSLVAFFFFFVHSYYETRKNNDNQLYLATDTSLNPENHVNFCFMCFFFSASF